MPFKIEQFINQNITKRPVSMFHTDMENNKDTLSREIQGKKVCVIGGAGSIGSSFIKALLPFEPISLVVVDLNENGLAELVRDVRSTHNLYCPVDFRCYTLDFASPIFERIITEYNGFDIIANFSAHKHVRSEKDKFSVEALIENNDLKAKQLLDLLIKFPPKHFFCVSTDKAANPVNIMGASKKIMEELIMAYQNAFKVTTARFANVAFSNGSLPDSWIHRMKKNQPLVAPTDIKRYFVSPEESGQICLLACILGKTGEVFFPKFEENEMMTFSEICYAFLKEQGYSVNQCDDDNKARILSHNLEDNSTNYPVVFLESDTTGEKEYEEFFVPGEKINMNRFISLGVIENITAKNISEIEEFFEELKSIFKDPSFTKEQVVNSIKKFLPNFIHSERGKNLDQKM